MVMAVQAQYPANVLLLNRYSLIASFVFILVVGLFCGFCSLELFLDLVRRGETERKNKEMETTFPPTLLEQDPVFFTPIGGIQLFLFSYFFHGSCLLRGGEWCRQCESKEEGREAAMEVSSAMSPLTQQQMSLFSLQAQARALTRAMVGLPQFHSPTPFVVSTGLQLTFNDHNRNPREQLAPSSPSPKIWPQKLTNKRTKPTTGEQHRREMAAKRKNHYCILLATVEKLLGNKLREKEVEVAVAARRAPHAERPSSKIDSTAKAMAEQSAAASLQAQLQQAAAIAAPVGEECYGESPMEDAGSVFVDLDKSTKLNRPFWSCHTRPASVVLLPCRHLCICPACNSARAANNGCPACGCSRTGSLEVYFS
ncbi:hypothetical protein M5K25_027207 [Dendrobium thyrsiflorum]|uniref:RING-type domain-containing protein n=1 Tax=Dendrobium thyrsiflorum TaxID=117978 RepID=A0ABD0TZF0_DENTH